MSRQGSRDSFACFTGGAGHMSNDERADRLYAESESRATGAVSLRHASVAIISGETLCNRRQCVSGETGCRWAYRGRKVDVRPTHDRFLKMFAKRNANKFGAVLLGIQ